MWVQQEAAPQLAKAVHLEETLVGRKYSWEALSQSEIDQLWRFVLDRSETENPPELPSEADVKRMKAELRSNLKRDVSYLRYDVPYTPGDWFPRAHATIRVGEGQPNEYIEGDTLPNGAVVEGIGNELVGLLACGPRDIVVALALSNREAPCVREQIRLANR